MDGGVRPALLDFIRELFRCGRAARKVARTVVDASASLKAKIPSVILERAKRVMEADEAVEGTESDTSGDATDDAAMDDERVRRRHLPGFSREVADPVLADAGDVAGEERRGSALLRPKPAILVTAGSGERLVDFVCVVVVDPVVVRAPCGDWTAVGAVVSALSAEPFRRVLIRKAVRSAAVKELRLFHGAMVSLYPCLCHVWCSKAMNPDSFRSLDAQNTSASEERKAASRRLPHFLRLVKQRNFILFTVYQQAVGNIIAMHRDALDERNSMVVVDDWPLWYKKDFVDVADATDASTEQDGHHTSDGATAAA